MSSDTHCGSQNGHHTKTALVPRIKGVDKVAERANAWLLHTWHTWHPWASHAMYIPSCQTVTKGREAPHDNRGEDSTQYKRVVT